VTSGSSRSSLARSLPFRDPVELEVRCELRDTGRDGPADEASELYSPSLTTSSGLLMAYMGVCQLEAEYYIQSCGSDVGL
jgi:hypothetical protein